MQKNEIRIIYVDLSETIRLPYQLALDCAEQLDKNLLKKVYQTINKPLITKTYTQVIDTWVDIEAYDNIKMIKARDLATLIDRTLQKNSVELKINVYLGNQK